MTDQEMIRACAEQVMGWRAEDLGVTYPDILSARGRLWWKGDPKFRWVADFNPLTSDADAFMLVDAMEAKGWSFSMGQLSMDQPPPLKWVVAFDKWELIDAEHRMIAPGRCRAIVLACLKAVGVEGAEVRP